MVKVGDLRERVTLQSPQPTLDAVGDQVEAWVDEATVWARVQPLSGARGEQQAQREENTMRWRVTLRWRSDVRAGWRLLWRGRKLNVDAALPSERRDWLVLECVEVLDA